MLQRHRTRDPTRKVSPPGPVYMSNEQVASYLQDLRQNRPTRPNGSRPLPSKAVSTTVQEDTNLPPRASSALSMSRRSAVGLPDQIADEMPSRSASALSHHRNMSEASVGSSAGRSLVQQPDPCAQALRTNISNPPALYRENGQRWMERQEARALRDALEEMDLQDEIRIHAAAQDEATKLVWEHRNPGVHPKNPYAPYRNPDLNPVNRFRQHLEKGSHARSYSLGYDSVIGDASSFQQRRSASDGSSRSAESAESHNEQTEVTNNSYQTRTKDGSLRKKGRVNFVLPPESDQSEQSHFASSRRARTVSGDSSKGVFRNPEDHIYEEPEAAKHLTERKHPSNLLSNALKPKPRNSLPQSWRPLPGRVSTNQFEAKVWSVDVHKNAPSQSRNPLYTTNARSPPNDSAPEDVEIPRKDGVEIRSDDIRAATSMKIKDRSANLPMPTAVSDRPGQPIVSFDPHWASSEGQSKENGIPSFKIDEPRVQTEPANAAPSIPPVPSINVTGSPSIPTINLPDGNDNSVPVISVSPVAAEDSESARSTKAPPPNPLSRDSRQRKSEPVKGAPTSANRWYSPFHKSKGPTATCAKCSLPIAGKIVTAAGLRFHSECFSCHHCSTALECVAFYEEPEGKRAERLANTTESDEDARALRFYCHLDFHELFSPRCKSCKTPIEGEVVVACGAEWHVGHFFCAECGDPFTQETPFVESNGYAWCLRCYSRRSASRCLGCKQPVLDEVIVSALGGQWHDRCFVCHECGGGFGPEGRFFVKEGEPKRTAKGRIIGGPVQLAVCEGCEAIRLKA